MTVVQTGAAPASTAQDEYHTPADAGVWCYKQHTRPVQRSNPLQGPPAPFLPLRRQSDPRGPSVMPEERIIWTDAWVGLFGILALLQPGRIERDCLVTRQAINVDLLRFKLAPVPPSLSRPIKNVTLGSYNNIPVTSTPNDETPALPWALVLFFLKGLNSSISCLNPVFSPTAAYFAHNVPVSLSPPPPATLLMRCRFVFIRKIERLAALTVLQPVPSEPLFLPARKGAAALCGLYLSATKVEVWDIRSQSTEVPFAVLLKADDLKAAKRVSTRQTPTAFFLKFFYRLVKPPQHALLSPSLIGLFQTLLGLSQPPSPHEPSVSLSRTPHGIPWGRATQSKCIDRRESFFHAVLIPRPANYAVTRSQYRAAAVSADFSLLDTIDSLPYAYGKHLVFSPTGIPSFLQSPADLPSQTRELSALASGSNVLDPSTILDGCFKRGAPDELGFMRRVVADQGAASMFPPVHFDSPIFESLVDAGISPSTPTPLLRPPQTLPLLERSRALANSRKESPYRKKKRTSNKAASKANEAARLRKRQRSQMRLLEEQQQQGRRCSHGGQGRRPQGRAIRIPFKTAFTVDYQTEIDGLIASSEFQLICEVLTKLLDRYFPAIAAKYSSGRRQSMRLVKSPVKTVPHRDFKNVAIGIIYGNVRSAGFFDDGETAWLVNFEAGIVIQLPIGQYSCCIPVKFTDKTPSEFFSNEYPLKFVCTQNGEIPNSLNAVPLRSIDPGRASLVFFNPASFFYPLTTGFTTLEEARAAGLSGGLDFVEEARSSFNKVPQGSRCTFA
ncbi:hypothetical protein BS47DRAFT_1366264 [Hydnum rufescens UP504]|uniref:Uncharacterized protein n=1 Tax=Hydnum rufescens UP504 TaxID=1448309 RepID=A0A9P6AMJ0_9AGAM|nr:hypothetical protein BS47DRAFT_1366264 [Hydnum rufescens UP504]